ncbi:MAG: hypothetical protein C4532_12635 [Candidatus Abyssobacteria bacterium SURF_17]|jgi:hypothetical protein|uniref:Uncharacterized protein n=1 Tax=Candidatus Abyssobacteria bacterium SURF_17 TaxID=2093361 RepID=A0A419EVR5_9BACT|nr:MAG: hypothetical protein C4532_12635 [Candidatus Abyssubacteria bacterium SURF_17]
MLRALFWKEWRELWILPVGAAPVAAAIFFLLVDENARLGPGIWWVTFSMWLWPAAFFVPLHLHAREAELKRADFVLSRPIDRFRLWCFRQATGITILAACGLALFAVTFALSLAHPKPPKYPAEVTSILLTSICFSVFLYSLSSVMSTSIKRQATAMASLLLAILILSILSMFTSILLDSFDELLYLVWFSTRALLLLLSPVLLFASLAAFAGGNLRRRTWSRIVTTYTAFGVLAFAPAIIWLTYHSSEISAAVSRPQKKAKIPASKLIVHNVSKGGNLILLSTSSPSALVLVDLSARKLTTIAEGRVSDASMREDRDLCVYAKSGRIPFSRLRAIILSDVHGHNKKLLFRYPWYYPFPRLPAWSPDGTYLAQVWEDFGTSQASGFVAMYRVDGNLIGRHEVPVLESSLLESLGWDAESRYYFRKSVKKRGDHIRSSWRMRPNNLVPEQVHFLPNEGGSYISLSPDGRWAAYAKPSNEYPENRTLSVCDILSEKTILLSDDIYTLKWSADGKLLAYFEGTVREAQGDEQVRRPLRLVVYELGTGESQSFPLESVRRANRLQAFSPTNQYLLLKDVTREYSNEDARRYAQALGLDKPNLYVLAFDSGIFTPVQPPQAPTKDWPDSVHWISGDRLLWGIKDRLIVTDAVGSNPKGILRFEGGQFHFNGGAES